ncbi:MAG: hypothetical protein L3J57_14650 [Desulfuromusa sp.]|nr:hypothetical protein [Desulfuromusa sp.]
MGFSERLNSFIKTKKLKKKDLPERWNLGRTTLFSYLNGESAPTVIFITTLKNDFPELNINWLITGVGEMESRQTGVHQVATGNGHIQVGGSIQGTVISGEKGVSINESETPWGNDQLVKLSQVSRVLEDYMAPKIIKEIEAKLKKEV